MTGITDANSLDAWLEDKPPALACVIALRAALRVVPVLAGMLHNEDENKHRTIIVLLGFRALAIANFAVAWPLRAAEVRNDARSAGNEVRDAMNEISKSAQENLLEYMEISPDLEISGQLPSGYMERLKSDVQDLGVAGHAVDAAVSAAQGLVDSVDAARGVAAPNAAAKEAAAACVAAYKAFDGVHGYSDAFAAMEEDAEGETEIEARLAEFWKAVERDADVLTAAKVSPADQAAGLFEKPLWHEDLPVWAGRQWASLKDELPEEEEWWVWIDWYEARMTGQPGMQMLEFDRATIPGKDWKQGPAHVNAILAKLIRAQNDPMVAAVLRGFEEVEAVKEVTSDDLTQHTDRIRDALPNDPFQAIGATKDMLEATMKTILHRRGCDVTGKIAFPDLTTRCLRELNLTEQSPPATESERYLRKISSNAQKMINAANELRNRAGTGHGRVLGEEPVVTAADAGLVASMGMIMAAWLLRHDGEARH